MHWFALILAGCMEVFGVMSMKRLVMKKWDGAIYLILSFGVSFSLLTYSMQSISMGTAYGVWTGLGTVGATVVGMVFYDEPKEWKRLFFISLILASAIGLKLLS